MPILVGISGWVVLGITALAGPGLLRSFAVFAFALTVPGLAVVRLLPLPGRLQRAVLSAALSMSLSALVAEAAAILRHPQAGPVLAVLASLCTAAAVTELARGE